MEKYTGPERRAAVRIPARYVVSYRRQDSGVDYDITQLTNISTGGVLLTSSIGFNKGDRLKMNIRFPFDYGNTAVSGEVVDSQKVVRLIYETRLKFLDLAPAVFQQLADLADKKEEL